MSEHEAETKSHAAWNWKQRSYIRDNVAIEKRVGNNERESLLDLGSVLVQVQFSHPQVRGDLKKLGGYGERCSASL